MKALVYKRSVPLYLLSRILGRIQPRRFFHRLAPFGLKEIPPPGTKGVGFSLKTAFAVSAARTLGSFAEWSHFSWNHTRLFPLCSAMK